MKYRLLKISSFALCSLALASCGAKSDSTISNTIIPLTEVSKDYSKMDSEAGKAEVNAILDSMEEKINKNISDGYNLIITSENYAKSEYTSGRISEKTNTVKSIIDFNNNKFSAEHNYINYDKGNEDKSEDYEENWSINTFGTITDDVFTCYSKVRTNNYRVATYEKTYDALGIEVATQKTECYSINGEITYTGNTTSLSFYLLFSQLGLSNSTIEYAEDASNNDWYFEYYKNSEGNIIRNLYKTKDGNTTYDEPVLWQSTTFKGGIIYESQVLTSLYESKDYGRSSIGRSLVKYEFTKDSPLESTNTSNIITKDVSWIYNSYFTRCDNSTTQGDGQLIIKDAIDNHFYTD